MKTDRYLQMRKAGYRASEAFYAANVCEQWESMSGDKVRLSAVPEHESYFDIYGEPEGYTDSNGRIVSPEQERKEIEALIERNGIYTCVSYYMDEESGKWIVADSIGMCIYNNPLSMVENCYIPDFMRAAMNAYNAQDTIAACSI